MVTINHTLLKIGSVRSQVDQVIEKSIFIILQISVSIHLE